MENPVIIFGANHLGRAAKEIFETNSVVVYGFLDDNKKLHNSELDEVIVLGDTDNDGFLKLIGKKCEAFVAVDDNKLRKGLVKMLQEIRHVQPVNAIHSKSAVSQKAGIGHGNFIDFNVYLAPGSKVGSHCILNARAYIGVECVIGDFVQIGAGSSINAGATIEDEVFIGSGVTVVAGVTIGKGARVGAGSVVIANVKAGETVFG
ncbi:MAG: NeuD/PglB/VioB family sugar acetyltransferase, partial [Cyclobacteriaceae bacterium]|nr:NeuD/PglB/VioB family sugar acetyltransferase [Cyclobacteriaceae bacterium]